MQPDFTSITTNKPSRVLVAGAGSIGLRHARLWRELPGVKVGVCDPSPAALQEAKAQDFLFARSGKAGMGCTAAEGCLSTELMEVFLQSLREQRRVPFKQPENTHEQ